MVMTILGVWRSEVACPRVEEAKWPGTNSRKGADLLAYNMYTPMSLLFIVLSVIGRLAAREVPKLVLESPAAHTSVWSLIASSSAL
jgi:hypothetical protein